jgi:hypothetical protein
MTASRALYMGQAYRSVSRSRTGGDISVYTTDHPCSKDLAISARTLPQMPSPPASTNQPARTFETDETRPDSTAGQDSSNSVSAGGSSQHTQPKDDGPVDSDISQVKPVVKPSRMTLEEAERILGMGCGDYWKKHSDFEFQVEEIPAGKRYGIFREVNNKFEPCVDWQESWVDVIDRLWDVQYDFWSSHEMRAKIVYAVHWVEAPRPGKRREKWSAGMSKTSSRDRRL